jgi:hypothetical protein
MIIHDKHPQVPPPPQPTVPHTTQTQTHQRYKHIQTDRRTSHHITASHNQIKRTDIHNTTQRDTPHHTTPSEFRQRFGSTTNLQNTVHGRILRVKAHSFSLDAQLLLMRLSLMLTNATYTPTAAYFMPTWLLFEDILCKDYHAAPQEDE